MAIWNAKSKIIGLAATIILFFSNICLAENDIIVLVSTTRNHDLSRTTEQYFSIIKSNLKQRNYKFVTYYGEKLEAKYHKEWGIVSYPTVIYFKKIEDSWYKKTLIFDKPVTKSGVISKLRSFLGIPARRVPAPIYQQPGGLWNSPGC